MRKLLLLVFVAAMCVPSYGSTSTLVYKTSQKTSVFDTDALVKQTLSGYLVLNVNLDTQDVCDAQHLTYWGVKAADKKQQTVNVTLTFASKGGYIVADYLNGTKDAVLAGKYTDGKAVNLAGKNIAKTLNGSMLVGDLGFGTMGATLDVKWTKNHSTSDVPTVIGLIQDSLVAKYPVISDTTKPTPNPMTWASVPAALSNTQITMAATTATDTDSPPVEYSFVNSTDTSHNSPWQLSPTWTDSGLTPDTNYTYTVTARDSAAVPNLTDPSASASATTNKTVNNAPPTPNPMTWATGPNATSDTQIVMTATTATDINAPPVMYYFTNKQDPNNHNSGWQLSPTFIDTNLTPNTRYDYNVMARDNAVTPNITARSVDANATTNADRTAPAGLVFSIAPHATGSTSIAMQARATDASVPIQYQFRYSTGSLGIARTWSADGNFTDTGLAENTPYSYQVQAKDSVGNLTAWSTAAGATTTTTIKTQINQIIFVTDRSATTPTFQPVTITIVDGNYIEDVEINEPNITLQSTNGSAATIIQLVASDANGINIKAFSTAIPSTGCTIGGSAGHGFAIKSAPTVTDALIGAGQDNTVVSYCDLNSVGAASKGVLINKATGVTIANNNFVNDGNGVYLGGGLVRNISITTNTFTKSGTDANFVKINGSDANVITITGNTANEDMAVVLGPNDTNLINLTITDNTFTRGGILLYEVTPAIDPCDPNRLRNVTISGNTFAAGSTDTALVIDNLEATDANWASISFTGNSILRSPGGTRVTVDNIIGATAATLLAPHNYWGATDGPIGSGCGVTGGASVSTFVTYQPFWTNAGMTTDANCP